MKLRLVNEMDSDHPMHHPFHIHGAGRFVVLARDGVPEDNLVWKDTVLVRTGETVDILLDVTNPGSLDGALPHRRAPRERDDVQLRRGTCGLKPPAGFIYLLGRAATPARPRHGSSSRGTVSASPAEQAARARLDQRADSSAVQPPGKDSLQGST